MVTRKLVTVDHHHRQYLPKKAPKKSRCSLERERQFVRSSDKMRGKRRGEAKKLSDEDAEERLNKLLVDSGERDRLRERLSKKLDADGWREEVKVGAL